MKEITPNELKKIQLDILKEVHNFCIENNIKYSLAYGTMIGAVRHKGYIPWDDDIDIFMLRSDYEQFIELFNKRNSKYRVVNGQLNKSLPFVFSKIENTETVLIEKSSCKFQLGVNIDLFPLDYVPDDLNGRVKLYKKIRVWDTLRQIKVIAISNSRSFIKNLILGIGKLSIMMIPVRFIISRHNQLINRVNKKTNTIGDITNCDYNERPCISLSAFKDTESVEFEGYKFNIMTGWKEFLTNVYGDFMQLPPIDKQVTHHAFKAYWND